MIVEILTDSYREIISRKTGKAETHRFQEVFVKWAHEKYPRPATIYLGPETKEYLPGEYELDIESSLSIRNDRLEFRNIVLKPIRIDNSGGGPRQNAQSSSANKL